MRRIEANNGLVIAYLPHQQARYVIKVKLYGRPTGSCALDDHIGAIVDCDRRKACVQVGEVLLDERREGKFGVRPSAFEITPGERHQWNWLINRRNPRLASGIRRSVVSAESVHDHGAQPRSLGIDIDR